MKEWQRLDEAPPEAKALKQMKDVAAGEQSRPPEFTDEALALHFAKIHASDLRYVAAWGTWLIWTGTHWKLDATLFAYDQVRIICRTAATECGKPALSSALASAKTVAAVERLAKSDRRLAATVDQWDAEPWSLNTPGGTWDLRKGICRPHRPDDYCTKISAVSADGECPQFVKFLEDVSGCDQDLIAYLRRWPAMH